MARDVRYDQHGREVTKSGTCEVSGKRYQVTVTASQFRSWQEGTKVQHAMPDLNAEQREFWISNTTPDEWHRMFPGGIGEDEECS